MFVPDRCINSIFEISPQRLRELGYLVLIADLDDTLVGNGVLDPTPELMVWLDEMNEAGIKVAIISNNSNARVEPFCRAAGLPYIARGAKPFPHNYRRMCSIMGVTPDKCIFVGDQIFTDILGARLAGIYAVKVPAPAKRESLFFRVKRALEAPFLREYSKRHGDSPL